MEQKVRILWSGLTGELGHKAYKLAQVFPNAEIVAGVTRKNCLRYLEISTEKAKFPGVEWHSYRELHNTFVDYTDFDVIVEASHASNFDEVLSFAVRKEVPLIVGTSGLGIRSHAALIAASRRIPIFRSSDFAGYIDHSVSASRYDKAAYAILEIASKMAKIQNPGEYSNNKKLLAS